MQNQSENVCFIVKANAKDRNGYSTHIHNQRKIIFDFWFLLFCILFLCLGLVVYKFTYISIKITYISQRRLFSFNCCSFILHLYL